MATEEQVENIRQHVEKATGFDIDYLTMRAELGTLNFRESKVDLEQIHELLKPLSTHPTELLTQGTADSIIHSLESLHPIIDGIRDFDVERESPHARDQLVAQLHGQTEAIVEIVAPWLPYLAYAQGDVQKSIQQITDAVTNARAIVEAGREDVDKGKQEIASIIDAARDASAEAGVATFTRDFADKAAALEKTARWWLAAAAMFVLTTISFAIVFAHGLLLPAGESLAELLQVATTKLIVLGLLFSATIWCGRLYKATKHQAAVNEFRANGLKSFQAFVAATDDDATRNAVLLETTRAIFAHAPTGLIDAKAGDSEGSVRVVEVAKDAARKATPAADDTA